MATLIASHRSVLLFVLLAPCTIRLSFSGTANIIGPDRMFSVRYKLADLILDEVERKIEGRLSV
jgi:hypothetical protein